MQENTSKKLFDLLLGKDYNVKLLNSKGKPVTEVTEADIFNFDFNSNNTNYGTVVILLGGENNFEIFFGDNIGRGLERNAKNTWYDLLYQLRMFAKRNMLSFSLKNINKLKHTMQGLSALKEGLFEGWKGTSRSSYNPQKNKTRLVIRHNKRIGETDQRFRNIKSMFIENSQGERFKLPFTSIAGARAMARHVAEGGTPYDLFGTHITETVNNIITIGNFLRTKPVNESETVNKLIEVCKHQNKKLKKNIKLMSGVRGYNTYKEAWDPIAIEDNSDLVEQIRDLIIPENNTDDRLTSVLPIIAGFLSENQEINNSYNNTKENLSMMKEVAMFESWAQSISEGTWAIPDSPEAIHKLKEILKQELPVGADATNATEVLYDIIGDDMLFDELVNLAYDDPEADARDEIYDWIYSTGQYLPGMEKLLSDLGLEEDELEEEENTTTSTNTAEVVINESTDNTGIIKTLAGL